MKKIFGIFTLFFTLLSPTLVSAQCGTCQTILPPGQNPGEEGRFYGQTIDGFITGSTSNNMAVPVKVTIMQNNVQSNISIVSKMELYAYRQMKLAYCPGKNYLLINLDWEPGYYAMISGTWIPGRYKIIGWDVKEFDS